jgi:hypothetical protein
LQFLQAKYPDRLISQAIVSKIESKFRRTGHVKAMSKTGRPKINEDTKIDILVNMEQNPHGSWLKKLKWKVLKTPRISDHYIIFLLISLKIENYEILMEKRN